MNYYEKNYFILYHYSYKHITFHVALYLRLLSTMFSMTLLSHMFRVGTRIRDSLMRSHRFRCIIMKTCPLLWPTPFTIICGWVGGRGKLTGVQIITWFSFLATFRAPGYLSWTKRDTTLKTCIHQPLPTWLVHYQWLSKCLVFFCQSRFMCICGSTALQNDKVECLIHNKS